MFEQSQQDLTALSQNGIFLCAGENVMTVGWGAIGYLWKKPVVFIPVRESRYTKTFLDAKKCFTLSLPYHGMKKELAFCGSKSGRDTDKFSQMNMQKIAAKSVDSVIVGGCQKYYECKTIADFPLSPDILPPFAMPFYNNGDYHRLYIGEIVNEYCL